MNPFHSNLCSALTLAVSLMGCGGASGTTPSPAPVAPASATNADIAVETVAAHNAWRTLVGVPNIAWSNTLAATAQAYADHLKATNNCAMVHSGAAGLGENLYWASGLMYGNGTTAPNPKTPTQVVDAWASEKANYTYASNSCAAGKVCGHYTQLVWANTTQVGCGHASCSATDNSSVWVCNYAPPGNYVGQKPY